MFTKEELEQRVKELESERDTFVQQAQAQLTIQEGRIQELKFLVEKFDKKEDNGEINAE